LIVPLVASCSMIPGFNEAKKQVEGIVATHKELQAVPQGKQVSVWFVTPHDDELTLTPVQRSAFGKDIVETAVEELLKGPDATEEQSGISSEIPKGTILLGVERKDDEIVLNLSRRFASGSGATSMETRMEQLSKTMQEIAGSSKVFVNVEGERLTASAADGLEIQQPIY
jgi:spore germination protein GerM